MAGERLSSSPELAIMPEGLDVEQMSIGRKAGRPQGGQVVAGELSTPYARGEHPLSSKGPGVTGRC